MTTDEIRTLRTELERSFLAACYEFKSKTGLSVIAIDVRTVKYKNMRDNHVSCDVAGLSVVLESL